MTIRGNNVIPLSKERVPNRIQGMSMYEPGGISRALLLGSLWPRAAAWPGRVFQSGIGERKRIKESLSITRVGFIASIYGPASLLSIEIRIDDGRTRGSEWDTK